MQTLKFKTSLKCNGCKNNLHPYLDNIKEVLSWNIDLDHPDKILEINVENINIEHLLEKLKPSGYQFTLLQE
jgi:copper chaperone